MHEAAGVYDFAAIGELAETTTQLLALGIMAREDRNKERDHAHARVTQFVMQRARDYLGEVREGFVLSTKSWVNSKSSSVSPGKPSIISIVIPIKGILSLSRLTNPSN